MAVHRLLGVVSKAHGSESTSIDAIPMFGVLLQLAELRGRPFALTLVIACLLACRCLAGSLMPRCTAL